MIGILVIYRQDSPFTDKQIDWSRILPPRPLSPSRTPGLLLRELR